MKKLTKEDQNYIREKKEYAENVVQCFRQNGLSFTDVLVIGEEETSVCHVACTSNDGFLLESLLHWGADPFLVDNLGRSPAHAACIHFAIDPSYTACVDLLHNRGAQFGNRSQYQIESPIEVIEDSQLGFWKQLLKWKKFSKTLTSDKRKNIFQLCFMSLKLKYRLWKALRYLRKLDLTNEKVIINHI